MTRPLSMLLDACERLFGTSMCGRALFCLPGFDDGMSVPVTNRADEYLRIFGDSGAIYDLDQTPTGRPRLARSGLALFTLTAHTRLAWCPEEGRALRRNELAAAQGLPSNPALACALGIGTIDFDRYSRSCAARLIGNGMSLPCIGSILFWCSRWISPSTCEIPPTVVGPCHDGSRSCFDDAPAHTYSTTYMRCP